jgi:cbb3-type cytochrome c oxidase subunit III
MAADNTTGHVWDGTCKEMNNPLPRWWVYLFIITVVFGLIYGRCTPMFGKFQGVLGWSSQGQHTAEVRRPGGHGPDLRQVQGHEARAAGRDARPWPSASACS